jgi:DNA primase
VAGSLGALAARGSRDPMDVVEDPAQKALLAEALLAETEPPSAETVISTMVSLQQRGIEAQLREVRAQIAEAERRGDFAELAILTQRKLELDRALRQLRSAGTGANS